MISYNTKGISVNLIRFSKQADEISEGLRNETEASSPEMSCQPTDSRVSIGFALECISLVNNYSE